MRFIAAARPSVPCSAQQLSTNTVQAGRAGPVAEIVSSCVDVGLAAWTLREDGSSTTHDPGVRVPSIDIRSTQRQSASLSPRLQQAVRLLQMSSMDFSAMLQDTLGRNPFLEVEEGADEDTPPANEPGDEDPGQEDHHDGLRASDTDAETDPDTSSDRDLWQAETGSALRRADDGEMSALDRMPVEATLNSHLHGQLKLLPLSPRDLALARALVESLDDDGYLRTPLEDLLDVVELAPAVSLAELQTALCRVQSLDPSGVGARSVGECLMLQLPAITCARTRRLAQAIVGEHLKALAARDVGGLARALGESPQSVEEVCDRIRHLDPRPGWRFSSTRAACVVPDVIVRKVRGEWQVQLNPAIVPRLRLNQVYAQLFQRHRTAHNAEMGAQLLEARWTLRNVDQRFGTILDVAEAIVQRQRNFLDYGAMAMKPLGLREIADAVGMHESTVSRVTNNKYMSTPVGVFELKYFFSRAMLASSGSSFSGTAIRGLIKDIIDAEDVQEPLSDVAITRQLAGQGLVMARRTVTKYRQTLKIEAVDRRRRQPP